MQSCGAEPGLREPTTCPTTAYVFQKGRHIAIVSSPQKKRQVRPQAEMPNRPTQDGETAQRGCGRRAAVHGGRYAGSRQHPRCRSARRRQKRVPACSNVPKQHAVTQPTCACPAFAAALQSVGRVLGAGELVAAAAREAKIVHVLLLAGRCRTPPQCVGQPHCWDRQRGFAQSRYGPACQKTREQCQQNEEMSHSWCLFRFTMSEMFTRALRMDGRSKPFA